MARTWNMVRELINAGANINSVSEKFKCTPLCKAAEAGNIELISLGAIVNGDENGNPPLYQAIWGGHLEVLKELVHCGTDVNRLSKTPSDCTALILARKTKPRNNADAHSIWSRCESGSRWKNSSEICN